MSRLRSATDALAPGALLQIAHGDLTVQVAPSAGGRIAQITHGGVEWLRGYDAVHTETIAWGSYPMLPWAGRIRHGRFAFDGHEHRLAINHAPHAIHGVAFALRWLVEAHSPHIIELSLELPEDEHWPFGGRAYQRIEAGPHSLRMDLSVTAGQRAMPAVIGWHPWLHKPDGIEFTPRAMYPRDSEGIATLPLVETTPSPWDDCFINARPVRVQRAGQTLTLASDCTHWCLYDEPTDATCIEPQSGPPDAFNLDPEIHRLAAGAARAAWFLWEWG